MLLPLGVLYLFAGRHQSVLLRLGGESHEVLQRSIHISQQHEHNNSTKNVQKVMMGQSVFYLQCYFFPLNYTIKDEI